MPVKRVVSSWKVGAFKILISAMSIKNEETISFSIATSFNLIEHSRCIIKTVYFCKIKTKIELSDEISFIHVISWIRIFPHFLTVSEAVKFPN